MNTSGKPKRCVKCGETKPDVPANFVPNRPRKTGRPDLVRTSHNTCKVCESAAKKVAAKERWDAERAQKKLLNDMTFETMKTLVDSQSAPPAEDS